MGKFMSKMKFVSRPLKNYNVESRAFKVISRDKPEQAPTHPSLTKIMEQIKNDPDLLTKGKPTESELSTLNSIFVKSFGSNPSIISKSKLPSDTHTYDEYVYGMQEPLRIPIGKISLRSLLELLEKHETSPSIHTQESLAINYKLKKEDVHNILNYFKTFKVYAPERQKPTLGYLLKKPFVFEDKKKIKEIER